MARNPNSIEIHLRSPEQLYNSLDPSPFHERDLDDEAERYIVGSAREVRGAGQLHLVITLPSAACDAPMARQIPHAIKYYFTYRARQARQNLNELLTVGWRFLGIGLTVLALCFLAIQYLNVTETSPAFVRLLEQSLLILGWVANWRPLEIFLYDWLPIRRQVVLLQRIAAAQVTVTPV
jgi:hypothetical protein